MRYYITNRYTNLNLIDTFKSLYQHSYTKPLAFNIPRRKKEKIVPSTPPLPLASVYLFSTSLLHVPTSQKQKN